MNETNRMAVQRPRRHVSTLERLADEIIELLGNDVPDGEAHRRWLVTLGVEKLKERLQMLREQSEAGDGAAREIRLASKRARMVHREICLSNA